MAGSISGLFPGQNLSHRAVMEFIGLAPVLCVGRAAWNCRVTGEKDMTKFATLALAATIAGGVAGSAMAQTGGVSPSAAAPSHKAKVSVRHARPLYNMAPGSAPVNGRDDPAFTGGGSLGYNQMIYNW
jgi:hypothetical protein